MINEIENLRELLREAHKAAEDLRCALNEQPEMIPMADRVLMLTQLASFQAHDPICHCEKDQEELRPETCLEKPASEKNQGETSPLLEVNDPLGDP